MRFYLAWNTVGTNKSSLDEIADVYIQACGGTLCDADTSGCVRAASGVSIASSARSFLAAQTQGARHRYRRKERPRTLQSASLGLPVT
jgi:hypothetical protein